MRLEHTSFDFGEQSVSIIEQPSRFEDKEFVLDCKAFGGGDKEFVVDCKAFDAKDKEFVFDCKAIDVGNTSSSIEVSSMRVVEQATRENGPSSDIFVQPTPSDLKSSRDVECPKDDDGRPTRISVKERDVDWSSPRSDCSPTRNNGCPTRGDVWKMDDFVQPSSIDGQSSKKDGSPM